MSKEITKERKYRLWSEVGVNVLIMYNSYYELFSYQRLDENNKVIEMRQATHKEIYEAINKMNKNVRYIDPDKEFEFDNEVE